MGKSLIIICLFLVCSSAMGKSQGGSSLPSDIRQNPDARLENKGGHIKTDARYGSVRSYCQKRQNITKSFRYTGTIPYRDNFVYGNDNMEHFNRQCLIRPYRIRASLPLRKINVSSKFGYRTDPFTRKRRFHYGIDLQARMGEKTYAMLPGKVITVGRDKSRGFHVAIRHGNYTVVYCHLSAILVRKGQAILPGEAVGLVGSTGRSSGPHLHLAVCKGHQFLDPQIILNCITSLLNKCTPY